MGGKDNDYTSPLFLAAVSQLHSYGKVIERGLKKEKILKKFLMI